MGPFIVPGVGVPTTQMNVHISKLMLLKNGYFAELRVFLKSGY